MASVEAVAAAVVVAGQDLGVKYKHHKVDYNLHHKWGCCKHYKHWRTSAEDGHSHYRDSWDCPTDPWEEGPQPVEWERPNTDRTSQVEVVSVVEVVVLPTVPFWQVVEASPSHLAYFGEQNVLAEAGPTSFFGAVGQAEKCKKVEDPLGWALVDHQAAVLAEVAALAIVVVTWH